MKIYFIILCLAFCCGCGLGEKTKTHYFSKSKWVKIEETLIGIKVYRHREPMVDDICDLIFEEKGDSGVYYRVEPIYKDDIK